jgi:DNA-binding NtrC family response regulator
MMKVSDAESAGTGERLHTVLVVDDEEAVRESLELLLEDRYFVLSSPQGEDALAVLEGEDVDLVILDVTMPGMGGMETLKRIRALPHPPEVIMLSATDSARLGILAVKDGAYDYITKPFDADALRDTLERALEKRRLSLEVSFLRGEVEKFSGFGNMVGKDPVMREIFRMVEKVSRTDSSVLITGESGTGKELVARAIHSRGIRSRGPFVPVNCAAIPQELLESEFFGHERGSFTGAHARRLGKLELAHGGILFLDEISSLRVELQAKLLRVLQDREFSRVGGVRLIRVDVQFIAATNRDLRRMVAEGAFREDLFYRLNVVPIGLPPLRERRMDIPPLAEHLLRMLGARLNRPVPAITREALDILKSYGWPGNVRELENLLERIMVLSREGCPIEIEDLPLEIAIPPLSSPSLSSEGGLMEMRGHFERNCIILALKKAGGNQSLAARRLHIHRNTLLKKMSEMGITPDKD